MTVVVGTTPEIDRTRATAQALGERFVMVRWQRADLEAATRAILQDRERVHGDFVKQSTHSWVVWVQQRSK
jgi:hypothetical protein